MSLVDSSMMGIWPWEWPGDIADALKDAIGMLAAILIAFFIFVFGLMVILGKIAVPFGILGRWVVFLVAFGVASGVIYYVAIG